MKEIPIEAARRIAEEYGYDQVVIVARRVTRPGEAGGEHCTTYGVDPANCDVAAKIGHFFKHKLMGWPLEPVEPIPSRDEHETPEDYRRRLRLFGVYVPGAAW